MRVLSRLFGLLLLGLLAGMLLLGTSSCDTSRNRSDANVSARDAITGLSGAAGSRQIVQRNELGRLIYKTPQATLITALTHQLGDGTVIDRVLIRQAPLDDAKDKVVAPYYLIGMGLNTGHYRAIALPLRATDDGTYYLTPSADRYILTGTACPTCFFDFEDGHIIGTTCGDGSLGGNCTLQVLSANQVFPGK